MDFKELVSRRHSVRLFTDEKVPHDVLEQMISIAQTAPSSKNSKSSRFVLVEDKSVIEQMAQMRDRGSSLLKGAQAAIVVCGDETVSDIWVENSSISATFLQLAAVEFGLGSCWVHVRERFKVSTDHSQGTTEQYLSNLLGIPSEHRILCVIALGYEQRT